MKKYILLALIGIFAATSCYKDKGSYNYDFDNMNYISEVSFTPDAYNAIEGLTIELQQPLSEPETKRITVNVGQTISTDVKDLDFTWIRTRTVDGKSVKDTTYTQGYYDVDLEPGKDIEYRIMLIIKDNTTTLSNYTKLLVKTRPIFKNSLFVLHGTSNNTKLGNVEIIGTTAHVTEDVNSKVSPDRANPFASAVGLTYNAYLSYDYRLYKISYEHNLCVFNSNGTAEVYNPFGIVRRFPSSYVLPQSSEPFIFSKSVNVGTATSNTDYKCILSRNGRFYLAKTYLCYYLPGEFVYDNPELHQTDYNVKAATFTESHAVLWDAKGNRFLYVSLNDNFSNDADYARYAALSKPVLNANVDFSKLPETLNPQGKDAVYAYVQYIENFEESHPFFLFKDKAGDKFYLYELTPSQSTGGKDSKAVTKGDGKDDGGVDPSEPAFTISGKRLEGFNPGNNINSITYNSRFSTNYLFYANGNAVYRYDSSNGETLAIYEAPDGYVISTIKFRTDDSGRFVGDLPYYLSIGMNKGSEGAVTEIRLTNSADYDNSYEPLFSTGFGNIIDIQFAHIYTYAAAQ